VAEDVTPTPRPALPAPSPPPIERDEPAAAPMVTAQTRSEKARKSAFRGRFVAVYFVLAIVVGIAIGGLAVTLSSPTKKHTAKPASQIFSPSTTGELGAIDLAYAVQRTYRLPNGHPLAKIVASRNTLQDGQGGFLRIRFQLIQPEDALTDRDQGVVVPNDPIQFILCGEGDQCAIPGGVTTGSGSLLKRAGLELALRTFMRDASVDNVTVYLPSFAAKQGWQGVALVFDRNKINHDRPALLSQPLSKTIPGGVGSQISPGQITPSMVSDIEELTQPFANYYRLTVAGGRDAVIQLEPIPAP
jgi:hypothetical protein